MIARLLTAATLAATLAAFAAFAADSPAPMAAAPVATATIPAPASAPALAAKPAPVAATMPAKPIHHLSACAMSIRQAEHALSRSKQPSATIAVAWQHLDAAKQAHMSHQAKACITESHTATNMLGGKA